MGHLARCAPNMHDIRDILNVNDLCREQVAGSKHADMTVLHPQDAALAAGGNFGSWQMEE